MQNDDLTRFVVDELGKHRKPKDIVAVVCQRANMDWKQAERFVLSVQAANQREITGKQNQTLRLMTLTCLLIGPLGALGSVIMTLQGHIIWLIVIAVPPLAIPLNLLMFIFGLGTSFVGILGVIRGAAKQAVKITGTEK